MDALPVALSVRNRPILLAGDGEGALNRARILARTTARIRLIAPRIGTPLETFAAGSGFEIARRSVTEEDLDGCAAAFVALEDEAEATRLATLARTRRIPVNVLDRPAISSFIMPALVDRDPLVIAITSGGAAPVLTQRVRSRIERMLPHRIGRLAAFAEEFREALRRRWTDIGERRRIWAGIFDGVIGADVLAGNEARARSRLIALVNGLQDKPGASGVVHLVGAGPGDPDLLTLKALRALEQADVVIHDRLVGAGVLDLARREATRIAVGKAKGAHAMDQDAINALMLRHAQAGRTVVRLKGGDPFIFGRGGEEAAYLRAHGIRIEVVPGITAAAGCAAAAGIPLTHRDLASSVSFVTGHDARDGVEPDWQALAAARDTLVVYMGLSTAGTVAARLIGAGRAPATPVAIISHGTLPTQRTVRTTLAELDRTIAAQDIRSPALLVVGAVAAMTNQAMAASPLRAAAE